ncbi:MAG: hypothetical protein MUF14_08775 [Hyphomonadaceae bacterium]|nr:hypothetical protein [Hyphomonadaceae bacterium]
MKKLFAALGTAVLASLLAGTAQARPADCTVNSTTYVCDFTQQGGDGSFTITARGKDTYILVMNGDGTAFGFFQVQGRGRNVPVAGTFVRSPADTSCWINADVGRTICVRARATRRR